MNLTAMVSSSSFFTLIVSAVLLPPILGFYHLSLPCPQQVQFWHRGQALLFLNSNGNESEKVPIDCLKDAMDRMHALQQDDHSRSLLNKKQSIRIGPSSIAGAGNGVFATKNIKAGTIVGFFPVHGIGLERFDVTNAFATATEDDRTYFDSQHIDSEVARDNTVKHNYLHFLMGSRPMCGYLVKEQGGALYIDVNPNRPLRDTWISHLINDGAVVEFNTEEGLLDYYKMSAQRKNCVNIPFGPSPILATVTSSKVKKGDELFTTYGGSYWLDSLLESATKDGEEAEEPIDISDDVQLHVQQTARHIFDAMQESQQTHAKLRMELEQLFNDIR